LASRGPNYHTAYAVVLSGIPFDALTDLDGVPDGVSNTATLDGLEVTDTVRGTAAISWTGGNVPDGSRITGVDVVGTCAYATAVEPALLSVQLSNGTSAVGSTKTGAMPLTTLGSVALGGSTDTWGVTWTVAIANNLRLRVQGVNADASNFADVSIDAVGVTIYFEAGTNRRRRLTRRLLRRT
jgi:hypothetical protein